jgi:hypothetical protein
MMAHTFERKLVKPMNCVFCHDEVGQQLCIECRDPYCDVCFSLYHKARDRAHHQSRII